MDLPEFCPPGASWAEVIAFTGLAWLSGLLMGLAIKAVSWKELTPALGRRSSRRRRTGYYFSEETRSWGRRRWRARLAWGSVVFVVLSFAVSGAVATLEWKSHPKVAKAPASPP